MRHRPVFVYGTLMPGHHNHAYCLRGRTTAQTPAAAVGVGLYRSRMLPYAALTPGRCTHGYLIELVEDTYLGTMHALDDLEGFRPNAPAAHSHYVRSIRTIRFDDPETGHAKHLRAWIYLAGPDIDITALQPIPTGRWTTT